MRDTIISTQMEEKCTKVRVVSLPQRLHGVGFLGMNRSLPDRK